MTIETWVAFCVATVILTIIPGPIVLYLIAHTISNKRRETFYALVGVIFGDAILIGLSFLGLGALLLTSALAFSILKWAGALYLIYLGIKQFNARKTEIDVNRKNTTDRRGKSFLNGFLVALLNPKTIVFFISFFPQFIDPNQPVAAQFVVLFWSFLFFVTLTLIGYIAVTESASGLFSNSHFDRWFKRVSGSTMIGAGVWAALSKRSEQTAVG